MIRRPPRSTRTDTLFPYTTLFRSDCGLKHNMGTALPVRCYPETSNRGRSCESRRLPRCFCRDCSPAVIARRSEEHTSELQSLMRISYAVFCLKKIINIQIRAITTTLYKPESYTQSHTDRT